MKNINKLSAIIASFFIIVSVSQGQLVTHSVTNYSTVITTENNKGKFIDDFVINTVDRVEFGANTILVTHEAYFDVLGLRGVRAIVTQYVFNFMGHPVIGYKIYVQGFQNKLGGWNANTNVIPASEMSDFYYEPSRVGTLTTYSDDGLVRTVENSSSVVWICRNISPRRQVLQLPCTAFSVAGKDLSVGFMYDLSFPAATNFNDRVIKEISMATAKNLNWNKLRKASLFRWDPDGILGGDLQ